MSARFQVVKLPLRLDRRSYRGSIPPPFSTEPCEHCRMDPCRPTEMADFRLFIIEEKHVDLCHRHFTEALLAMTSALERLE